MRVFVVFENFVEFVHHFPYRIEKCLAFSLLELCALILALSLLLAAFAPVVSSKLRDDMSIEQGKKLATVCSEFSDYCALCYKGKECIVCERECDSGHSLDSVHCVCN